MMNDEWEERNGECRAPAIHHSSFIPHHSRRRGLSLLEVLVSMAVLSLGLLGVAALIPIGKMAMVETNKSDRTGACGRAGQHEIKVRRMLSSNNWASVPTGSNIFVLDPLGYLRIGHTLGGTSGIERINLQTSSGALTDDQAKNIFFWHDDLTYVAAKDSTNPTNGERPMGMFIQADGSEKTSPVTATQATGGEFSWFATVTPSLGEMNAGLTWNQRRQYSVSVVVCWRRTFDNTGETLVQGVNCDSATGYGGIGIWYPNTNTTVTPSVPNPVPKENEWVLLNGTMGPAWYRVASAGDDGTNIRVSLVGPDWYNGASTTANLIVVKGVTGVYTTTVQLDNDATWSK